MIRSLTFDWISSATISVPPADLEGVLLTHPKVVDAGVIGVWSEAEATELPR